MGRSIWTLTLVGEMDWKSSVLLSSFARYLAISVVYLHLEHCVHCRELSTFRLAASHCYLSCRSNLNWAQFIFPCMTAKCVLCLTLRRETGSHMDYLLQSYCSWAFPSGIRYRIENTISKYNVMKWLATGSNFGLERSQMGLGDSKRLLPAWKGDKRGDLWRRVDQPRFEPVSVWTSVTELESSAVKNTESSPDLLEMAECQSDLSVDTAPSPLYCIS